MFDIISIIDHWFWYKNVHYIVIIQLLAFYAFWSNLWDPKIAGFSMQFLEFYHWKINVWSFKQLLCIKIARSRLSFSYFLFSFSFLFNSIHCISIFRTRVRVRVTRSHGHTTGHKLHNEQKGIEGSERDDVIPHVVYMVA